jgi:hypothetical protein
MPLEAGETKDHGVMIEIECIVRCYATSYERRSS